VLIRKRSAVEPVSVSVEEHSRGRQNERCLLYRCTDLAERHSWSAFPDADLQSLSCTLDELFAQRIYCRQGESSRRVPMHPDGNRVVVIFLFGKRRVNGHVDVDQVAFFQRPSMARRSDLWGQTTKEGVRFGRKGLPTRPVSHLARHTKSAPADATNIRGMLTTYDVVHACCYTLRKALIPKR
jgi:hypothetical protein